MLELMIFSFCMLSSILLAFASRAAMNVTLTLMFFLFLPLGLVLGWALPYIVNWVRPWLSVRKIA